MDDTIFSQSPIGKRLEKVKRREHRFLFFEGKKMPLTAKITIGRDKNNTIVIDDMLVSRNHALIQKIKEEYYVKDLGSSNGTYVNKSRIPGERYIKLNTDDVISVGTKEFSMM